MSKHTPGPWRAEMNGFGRVAVIDKNYNYLTYKAGSDRMQDEELEANARLIAAAPDLLKALIDFLDDTMGDPEPCRKAIAKALGKSS